MDDDNESLIADEREVLRAIFDYDDQFQFTADDTVRYRFALKSGQTCVVDLHWPTNYPTSCLSPKTDIFANRQLPKDLLLSVDETARDEAERNAGQAATFAVIERLRQMLGDFEIEESRENIVNQSSDNVNVDINPKEQVLPTLSKAQKRKQWDKGGPDKQRGWNWVDIIKHLSQTGSS
ncbi:hypothetical protein GJ496_000764 [Pomphorhynchus laevis]|nr:hypothetical protein GJ496_000764 [Pomphorhynchus laevis]